MCVCVCACARDNCGIISYCRRRRYCDEGKTICVDTIIYVYTHTYTPRICGRKSPPARSPVYGACALLLNWI